MSRQSLLTSITTNDLVVNRGSAANSKDGDSLRAAFGKLNESVARADANFAELYATASADVQIPAQTNNNGKFLTTNGTTLSWSSISQEVGTGNTGFSNDTVYNLNGMMIDNSDLVSGATARITIPENGETVLPLHIQNNYGSVVVTTGVNQSTTQFWTFTNDGKLQLPVGGDIVDSNNTSVLSAGNPFNQTLNNTDIVRFTGVRLGISEQQGTQYISVGGTPNPSSAVIFTVPNWITSAKLIISVDGYVDGDMAYTGHSQTCEATIAGIYNSSVEPAMSVYGLIYTTPTPLATFNVQRGVGNSIEVVATNTQTNNPIRVKVHAVNFVSYFD